MGLDLKAARRQHSPEPSLTATSPVKSLAFSPLKEDSHGDKVSLGNVSVDSSPSTEAQRERAQDLHQTYSVSAARDVATASDGYMPVLATTPIDPATFVGKDTHASSRSCVLQ